MNDLEYVLIEEDNEFLETMICFQQDMNNLVVDMIRSEHNAIIEKDVSIYERASGSFLKNVFEFIKKFWDKVVRLFTTIWDKIVGVFVNKEKWIDKNKHVLESFDESQNIVVNLPENFSSWNPFKEIDVFKTQTDSIKHIMGQFISYKSANREMIDQREIGSLVENIYFNRPNVKNKSNYYNEIMGKEVSTKITRNIIGLAMGNIESVKVAKEFKKTLSKARSLLIAKDFINGMIQGMTLRHPTNEEVFTTILQIASHRIMVCYKILNNAIVKMMNYSWQVCRRSVVSKEEIRKDNKETRTTNTLLLGYAT